MTLTINGKITDFHQVKTGTSQRGEWKRGGFTIETQEEYPKKVAFTLFGDEKLSWLNGMQAGTMVMVEFRPESREYGGNWYTDLQCVRIVPATAQAQQPMQQPAQQQTAPNPMAAAQTYYQQPQQQYAQRPQNAPATMPADPDLPF